MRAFLPHPEEMRASYADEAAAAKRRRETLEATPQLAADLALFPVPGGGTLLDWVGLHLGAGLHLSTLLSGRADLDNGARRGAGVLRVQTVALLNRARAAVADDVEANPALPRDLDGQIFGFLDELEERRDASASAARSAAKAKGEPEEGSGAR